MSATPSSLYLWRNSDDRLFHDIRTVLKHAARSTLGLWRSARRFWMRSTKSSKPTAYRRLLSQRRRAPAASMAKPSSGRPTDLNGYACWIEAQRTISKPQRAHTQPTHRAQSHRTRQASSLVRKNSDANDSPTTCQNTSLPVRSAVQAASDNAAECPALDAGLAAHPGINWHKATCN